MTLVFNFSNPINQILDFILSPINHTRNWLSLDIFGMLHHATLNPPCHLQKQCWLHTNYAIENATIFQS
ncbi:MAG: hypothetical protein R3E08_07940, partial [Thiotrichaceae bacterium]